MPPIYRFNFSLCLLFCLTCSSNAQPEGKTDSLASGERREAVERAIADGKHQLAVQLLQELIELEPTNATAMYHLGRESFCVGDIDKSLAAFDRFLELAPSRRTSLWERGITCYYAKKFEQGRKQFELYQTYHSQDVENGVWHILCESGVNGFKQSSLKSLDIRNDSRVPMMKIYDLFRNKASPDDVLQAANTKASKIQLNRQRFYANLYVGLYFEATGNDEKTKEHLKRAVEHRIGHYMWDVARVHLERLQNERTQVNEKRPRGRGR